MQYPWGTKGKSALDRVSTASSCGSHTQARAWGSGQLCLRLHALRDSQVSQARLAHSRGDGFDGSQHGVEQLCELPSPFGLPPFFHNVAGQGEHVCLKGASVRHCGR